MWPIEGGRKESLEEFLREKLRLDPTFIRDDLGQVTLAKPKEPRNKNPSEYIVTFETKQIRDAIKAKAANLANFREAAGMRLEVPDHLQRDFQVLMSLSFDLKKKHPGLKRNIKFDEEDMGLFMDMKLDNDKDWKRVRPSNARKAIKTRVRTQDLDEDELRSLLGDDSE